MFDAEKCLGCGACFHNCPEEVLELTDAGPQRSLSHYHWSCITCKKCEELCPQEAVKVEQGFNLQEFLRRSVVKDIELELKRCSQCGNYFAPEVLLQDIRKKEGAEEPLVVPEEIYQICPECRKAIFAEKLKKIFNLEPLEVAK